MKVEFFKDETDRDGNVSCVSIGTSNCTTIKAGKEAIINRDCDWGMITDGADFVGTYTQTGDKLS